MMVEIVRGTVIGPQDLRKPYFFYTLPDLTGRQKCITQGLFENDGEAEAWFARGWPRAYEAGVEMRTPPGGEPCHS